MQNYGKILGKNKNFTKSLSSEIFELCKPYIFTTENRKQWQAKNNYIQNAKVNTNTNSNTVANKTIDIKKVVPSWMPKSRAAPIETRPVFVPQSTSAPTPSSIQLKKSLETHSRFFYPKQKDSLFWCFFILHRGFGEYEYPGTTTFVREKELKFEYIEKLRLSKQTLKTKKIRNIREDVEDELANKERIGHKTFLALCIAHNINVLFIHKKKCLEFVTSEDEPIHVIHQTDDPLRYSYETEVSPEQMKKYRTTYFLWENIDKPLKAPSAYKSAELRELCIKAGVPLIDGDKKTKKELYDRLLLAL